MQGRKQSKPLIAQKLFRFFGRQPIALVVRSKIYNKLQALEPLLINAESIESPCSVDYGELCRKLRLELQVVSERERLLKIATIQCFPGDDGILSKLDTSIVARRELTDEIAFLCRANRLGFSSDNLALAAIFAQNTLRKNQTGLNEFRNALLSKLSSTANLSLSCLLG
ncbi:MAG: hypothetical protein ACKVQS_10600 [Fimbriimonadaceae bacterium]